MKEERAEGIDLDIVIPPAQFFLTFAEDLMPLIIASDTIAQPANKQPVMMGLNSPDSSMEFVMSRAFRNQKYDVGELLEHSFTVD